MAADAATLWQLQRRPVDRISRGSDQRCDEKSLSDPRQFTRPPFKAWLAERTDRIEVFYVPSYAPDLNPDERLNADMKHAIGAKVPARTKSKLKAAAEEHMTMIGRSPDRVRAGQLD